ncbi:Galactose-1-phosphate uridylyltransferase [Strongyloides ratti]|uniref:Galactose-1-phosphate uridylyltransferase n=1 Tax=Strongyloides ratti TaxID=34506 RepID=A0A090LI22_STRRB|nr:Galactose-1-phosphate uridylyltransferase [Strongyloides ratti]CEF67155.1 Galactose-1-phosphate uridylyltransferase [Strongyloides ratti]
MTTRRYNPLLDSWVIVAANRLKRPWSGEKYDNDCLNNHNNILIDLPKSNPLAPGALRDNGERNPMYNGIYVFENDFPTFNKYKQDIKKNHSEKDDLFVEENELSGICKVICYSEKTSDRLSIMSVEKICNILNTWCEEFEKLKYEFDWIQIFENRGAQVGSSNDHPHCQLWAMNYIPSIPLQKDKMQKLYYEKNRKNMLYEYMKREIEKKERIIVENEDWIVLVPYWAFWPFETMILPKFNIQYITELTESKKKSFAIILKILLLKYDLIFDYPFPYMFGIINAPSGEYLNKFKDYWQLHFHFYPPLLRSSTIKKHLAGFEVFSEPQRDLTPEDAASIIKKQQNNEIHELLKYCK